jgi:hypothetical protein
MLITVVLLATAVLLSGQILPKAETVEEQAVRASEFLVVDQQGRTRARLGYSEGRFASLLLFDDKGELAAEVSSVGDGSRLVSLWGAGESLAVLRVSAIGDADVSLLGENGVAHAFLECPTGLAPRLTLSDDKKGMARLQVEDDPEPMCLAGGARRHAKSGAGLVVRDSTYGKRIWLGLRTDQTPELSLWDDGPRCRASMEVDQKGAPKLQLFDQDGKEIWKAGDLAPASQPCRADDTNPSKAP